MKPKTFLVQANNHNQQVITCAIIDKLVKNVPIPVVFFYRKKIHHDVLIDALKKVLSDFPIFAGTLQNINGNLSINCNNKGVLFCIAKEDCTLEQVLKELPRIKKKRLVEQINPKKVISHQSPIMTIKIVYFPDGGMTLGVCWHHSIGDMQTFMCLMKAWSKAVNGKEYDLPLIVRKRDEYLQTNLEKNDNTIPGVRYLNTRKLLGLLFYLLLPARNNLSIGFYFSKNELKNMRDEFSAATNQKLSINDVLCAHLFSIISELDAYNQKRYLSIVINYRSRTQFPPNISGNFISFINILSNQRIEPFQLARDIRASVDNFQRLHMNFFATKEYIEQYGGIEKIERFVSTSIDPLKRTLTVTNWANFDVYDVMFGDSQPFYFTPFGDTPFPWLSAIVRSFSSDGLVYYVALPSKLAKKLMQKGNLRKIHQYRDRQETIPEQIEKLGWLL